MTTRLALFLETLGMHPDFWAQPWKPEHTDDDPPF